MGPSDLAYGNRPALGHIPGGVIHALHEHLLGPLETVSLGEGYDEDGIRTDGYVNLQVRALPRPLCETVCDLIGTCEILPFRNLDLLVGKGDECQTGPAGGLELPECIDVASRRTHVDVVVVDGDLLAHGPEGETLTYIR